MNRLLMAAFAAAIALILGGLLAPKEASAGGPVGPYGPANFEIHQFYEALSSYGDWVTDERFGHVWYPNAVPPDWRPYAVGNWIYTEAYGWYWDSPEPFAWAVYHYGRWGYDPGYGWYWVPGDTWSPAWVRWRYSDEYVGWAPEAPITPVSYAGYGGDWGYDGYDNYDYSSPRGYEAPFYPPVADYWTFVRPRHLVAPAVRTYAVPRSSVSLVFNLTKTVYRPRYRNGHIYNAGIPRAHWSKVTRRHVKVHRVRRTAYRSPHHKARSKAHRRGSRDLHVYAPRVKKNTAPRRPPRKVAHKPPRRQTSAVHARAPRHENTRHTAARNPRGSWSGWTDPRNAWAGSRNPQRRAATLGALGQTQRGSKPYSMYIDVSGRPAIRNPHVERRASLNPGGNKPDAKRPAAQNAQAKKPQGPKSGAKGPNGKKPDAIRQAAKKAQAKKPQGPKSGAKRPDGKKPDAKRPQGKKAQSKKPQGPKQEAKRPNGKQPGAKRPAAKKAQASKPQGPKSGAKRPNRKKPGAKRPATQNAQAKKPQVQRGQAKRPPGKRPNGKKTQGNKAKGKKGKA